MHTWLDRQVDRSCHARQAHDRSSRLAEHIAPEDAPRRSRLGCNDFISVANVRAGAHVFLIHSMGLLTFGHRNDSICSSRQILVVLKQVLRGRDWPLEDRLLELELLLRQRVLWLVAVSALGDSAGLPGITGFGHGHPELPFGARYQLGPNPILGDVLVQAIAAL